MTTLDRRWLLGLLLVGACEHSPLGSGDLARPLDAAAPAPDLGAFADGGAPDLTLPTGACGDEIRALTAELYTMPQSCTAVVRLDHETRAILGYQIVCGRYAGATEAQARAIADADTGYGGGDAALLPANPPDEYVFYRSPGDFGGASAVAVRTSLSVFGGSIVWDGTGDITWPKSWRTQGLGSGCPASGGILTRRGYDLAAGGAALDAALVDAAVDVVLGTAIPGAMWYGGYVFDAVVLRYPRSVGAFNPQTAEWIVLVNGGWLE